MKTRALSLLVLILVLGLTACGSDDTVASEGTVEITTDPFSFVPTVGNAASFFTIANAGDVDDVLLSASTDQFGTVELHDTLMEDGAAQMVEQTDGIPVPAGGEVVLEPGGLHVMLLEATDELVAGDEITITLQFREAGEVTITSTVRERAEGDPQPMEMDDADMEGMPSEG